MNRTMNGLRRNEDAIKNRRWYLNDVEDNYPVKIFFVATDAVI
ncbi:hypothetical protein [Foetidibacter luteolus]|nr:hypothetical protein [Foetidibacter luteolus]